MYKYLTCVARSLRHRNRKRTRLKAGSLGGSSSRSFVTMTKLLNLSGPHHLYLLSRNNIIHPDFGTLSLCYEDEPR